MSSTVPGWQLSKIERAGLWNSIILFNSKPNQESIINPELPTSEADWGLMGRAL